MKIPHFFKAYSRIGLQNVPHRMSIPNFGVEEGADFVLSEDFLKQFPDSEVSEFIFTLPENIKDNFNKVFLDEMLEFADLISSSLIKNETQVVVGGEHSISFASILNTLRTHEAKKVGYIHFDSHPDANLWNESPTHNWHGMYLRPFLTKFDLPEIESLILDKLLPENVLFIGNLDADFGEKEMIKKLGIINIDLKMVRQNSKKTEEIIKKILTRVKFLHINFDIDVFDHSLAPSTSIPTPVGFMEEDIFPILELLKTFPDFALDQVEVNPKRVGGAKTVKLAQEILKFMLL